MKAYWLKYRVGNSNRPNHTDWHFVLHNDQESAQKLVEEFIKNWWGAHNIPEIPLTLLEAKEATVPFTMGPYGSSLNEP